MKTIRDNSFQNWALLETDPGAYFEKLLHELDDLEARIANADRPPGKIRLACNGELVGVGSIEVLGVPGAARAAEQIEFICPRCHQLHESPLLDEET